MLLALLHNKHQKSEETDHALSPTKDTLTACVFGRLRYVPAPCMQRIFQEIAARSGYALPDESLGSFLRLHFWPRYMLDGRAYMEPDIVAEFDRAVILVQSTLGDGASQHGQDQGQQELHSLRLAASYEKKMGKLVVLGSGKRGPKSEDVWRLSWRTFFHVIEATLPQDYEHERLLVSDIRSALELHGVETRKPVFLADLARQCPLIHAVEPREYLQGAME